METFSICKKANAKTILSILTGEATRYINQGGLYINQNRCTNIAEIITPTVHILANNYTLLRTGSRNYYIISWKM